MDRKIGRRSVILPCLLLLLNFSVPSAAAQSGQARKKSQVTATAAPPVGSCSANTPAITSAFQKFLGRAPSAAELATYQYVDCQTFLPAVTDGTVFRVILSNDPQEMSNTISRAYQAALGRQPTQTDQVTAQTKLLQSGSLYSGLVADLQSEIKVPKIDPNYDPLSGLPPAVPGQPVNLLSVPLQDSAEFVAKNPGEMGVTYCAATYARLERIDIPLILTKCNGGMNQQFTFRPGGDVAMFGNLCLQGDGVTDHPARLATCAGTADQKFAMNAAGQIVGPGGQCLEVELKNIHYADESMAPKILQEACDARNRTQFWKQTGPKAKTDEKVDAGFSELPPPIGAGSQPPSPPPGSCAYADITKMTRPISWKTTFGGVYYTLSVGDDTPDEDSGLLGLPRHTMYIFATPEPNTSPLYRMSGTGMCEACGEVLTTRPDDPKFARTRFKKLDMVGYILTKPCPGTLALVDGDPISTDETPHSSFVSMSQAPAPTPAPAPADPTFAKFGHPVDSTNAHLLLPTDIPNVIGYVRLADPCVPRPLTSQDPINSYVGSWLYRINVGPNGQSCTRPDTSMEIHADGTYIWTTHVANGQLEVEKGKLQGCHHWYPQPYSPAPLDPQFYFVHDERGEYVHKTSIGLLGHWLDNIYEFQGSDNRFYDTLPVTWPLVGFWLGTEDEAACENFKELPERIAEDERLKQIKQVQLNDCSSGAHAGGGAVQGTYEAQAPLVGTVHINSNGTYEIPPGLRASGCWSSSDGTHFTFTGDWSAYTYHGCALNGATLDCSWVPQGGPYAPGVVNGTYFKTGP